MPYWNKNKIRAEVDLSNGKTVNITIQENQAYIDDEGYIRFFTYFIGDYEVLNLHLLPRNSTKRDIVDFCNKFLVPLGISFAFNKITKNGNLITNIASHLFEEYSVSTIQDLIDNYNMSDYAYFAVDNGELVITHNLRMN